MSSPSRTDATPPTATSLPLLAAALGLSMLAACDTSGDDPGGDTGTDSGSDTETDSGADTGTDSGSDTETDSGADTGTDSQDDTGTVGCEPPAAPAIEHEGFIEADEVWGAGLHRVTWTVTVRPGATLTIEPCAVVELAPDQSIAVDGDAASRLVARGEPDRPVRFVRADPVQAWGSLNAFAPAIIDLAHVEIDGGGTTVADVGAAELAGASLVVRNQTGAPIDMLRVDSVTVSNSTGLGVMLDSAGFVAGSGSLAVTDSGTNPLYLGAGYASHLPTLRLEGNGDDRVLLQSVGAGVYDNSEPITWDAVLPDPGVPYLVGAPGTAPGIAVGDGRSETGPSTLTIEPGVELQVQGGDAGGAGVVVNGRIVDGLAQSQGAIVAVATAEAPIRMVSAAPEPGPGDWLGVVFSYLIAPSSRLAYVEIAHAGGESATVGRCVATVGASNSDADCSVILSVDAPPTADLITNTTLRDGNGCGIYRGWTGEAVDLSATNLFVGLSGCDQSNVYDEVAAECIGGACQ